jgi:hypothetical protein
MNANLVGALILAVPALAIAWAVLWRRQRPVFWFAAAMIVLGVGYLWATGAAGDIGRRWIPSLVSAPSPVPAR